MMLSEVIDSLHLPNVNPIRDCHFCSPPFDFLVKKNLVQAVTVKRHNIKCISFQRLILVVVIQSCVAEDGHSQVRLTMQSSLLYFHGFFCCSHLYIFFQIGPLPLQAFCSNSDNLCAVFLTFDIEILFAVIKVKYKYFSKY